jgi:23S rRNA pseudouridine1911/1915/1917 synthase
MGVAPLAASVLVLAKQYIKRRYQKPGNVYLGIMSRLDAASSGVLLLARTSKAAARLTAQFRHRSVEKTYWAIASGVVEPPAGEWIDWIVKDETHQRMAIANEASPAAIEARLRYHRIGVLGPGTRVAARGSLVEIDLLSGRKHQIRLQFASRGFPLWGDRKYGHATRFPTGIALHAKRLVVQHPVRKERLELIAPLPQVWRDFGIRD